MFSDKYEKIYVQGNIEYRKVIYTLLFKAAEENGFIEFLREPRTEEQICKGLGYLIEKINTLRAILNVFRTIDVITTYMKNDKKVYSVTNKEPKEFTLNINEAILRQAVGETKANEILYAKNLSNAFDYLKGKKDGIVFGKEKLDHWKNLLQFSFWEYGRNLAAEEIAYTGGKVIDLACGLGFGTLKLASLVGKDGEALGIEMSNDFVQYCRKNSKKHKNISFIQADLNSGLPSLPSKSYNGLMMIGAFHFIKDKEKLCNEIYDILTPGARLVIGNVIRKTDAYDQAAHELSLSMIDVPSYLIKPKDLEMLFSQAGFVIYDRFDEIGSAGWYCLSKK